MFRWGVVVLLLSVPAFTQQLASALGTTYSLNDAQLTGTASVITGSESESTSITLIARRDGKSRIDLGTRGEIRSNSASAPQAFFRTDSQWYESPAHNAWTEANWFFPALSTLVAPQERSATVVSSTSGTLRTFLNVTNQKPAQIELIKKLSATEYILDQSGLPVVIRYNIHPDDDFGTNIPVEVRLSDYRDVNGVKVPFRIQRLLSGSLELDITISSVTINPGTSDSAFAVR
ncbi:MAG TPA: hypothetical protein VN577_04805 [Terriglobales bacterium]|nr:hypothetical protein [Terriglobales bacterium]